jgi:hypothetical protein
MNINTWTRVIGECLVAPLALSHQLTGTHYRDLFSNVLSKPMQIVPLAVRTRLWYMHDSSLAHCGRAVRGVLCYTCHGRWIGWGGPTAWPAHSTSDLNPLAVHLWGHLNHLSLQLLLTTKRHFIALWVPVRLSTTASTSFRGCPPWDRISWKTFWALVVNVLFQE